jgi:Mn2+/Fe2+ NRAMP family transporter
MYCGADDLGLESAGLLLGEKYGVQYKYMWALGLLASGLSSTITLTYSGACT